MMRTLKAISQRFHRGFNHAQGYCLAALLMNPSLSHAQSIESILGRTTSYLQGGVARGLGILAIVAVGYLCVVRQKFPKEYFMMILVGLGIIFGGSSLYNSLVG